MCNNYSQSRPLYRRQEDNRRNRTHQDFSNGDNLSNMKNVLENANFNSSWITNEADKAMPVFAEKMGKEMAVGKLTNSKIRNIYGEIKRIQMGKYEKEKVSFFLLKPKVAYAMGRDQQNRGLILFKLVFDEASKYVTDEKSYRNFCNLIEAILAYHKAYGGKD